MAKSADCLRQTMFFQICWSLVQLPVGVAEESPGLIAGGVVGLWVYLPVSALLLTTLALSKNNVKMKMIKVPPQIITSYDRIPNERPA